SESVKGLEEERQGAAISEQAGREILERTVLIQEPRRRYPPDSTEARIPVRGVAYEGEKIGYQGGGNAEFLADAFFVQDLPALSVDLHDPIAPNALGQILVGRPDAHLLHVLVRRRDPGSGGKPVVCLQLD